MNNAIIIFNMRLRIMYIYKARYLNYQPLIISCSESRSHEGTNSKYSRPHAIDCLISLGLRPHLLQLFNHICRLCHNFYSF